MKLNLTKISFLAALVFLTTMFAVCPVFGQVGFQAELDNPPPVVSYYDEIDYRFSAAMYPKSFLPLSKILMWETEVYGSNFDDNSISFRTQYKRDHYLVPVSVDAEQYLSYRLKKQYKDKLEEESFKSYREAKRSKKWDGFSIGVALPKRLDKIFGEGGGNLKVSGYRRITFSGRSSWTDGESDLVNQSKFPSLNMEQQSKFEITGTIGSKISVKVYQDNQTDIPLSNRIQIRYKGDDDDILKSIEAGNTTLSLPNTKFVGYTSRIQGLFGIRTEAQLGNLTFTGIASQEKGSTESSSITASGEENADYTRDYDYADNRIFDLGYPIDDDTNPNRTELGRFDSVTTLFIYEYERDTKNLSAVDCKLFINPMDTTLLYGQKDSVRMDLLEEGTDYTFYNDIENDRHYVVFNSPRYEDYALGVYMEIKRFNSASESTPFREDKVGNLDGDVKILKALKPSSAKYTPDHQTWSLMWRNVYSIPRGLDISDIDVKVYKGLANTEGKSSNLDYQEKDNVSDGYYLSILGLDQYNTQGDTVTDNKLDENLGVYRSDWGLLIFPSRTPFDSDTTFTDKNGNETTELNVKVPHIYEYYSNSEKTENSQYYIQISTQSRSSIIKLDRTNIIEGSERVMLNGRQLTKGTDYSIQYDFGQITLLSDEALDPNAEIKVDFEYAPFFTVQKKTLLGARADYEFSKDFRIGATILYKSDKAQERKPRVGQETAKMVVLDLDTKFTLYPNFLTKIADALPLVSTDEESSVTVEGEVAESRPNPNVEGEAYIDDFEAAHDQLSLGLNRLDWTLASRPESVDELGYARGKLLWHSPRRQPLVEEVYDRESAQGAGSLSTLRLIFRPKTKQIVGDDTSQVASWAGIMRYFGNRVDADRAQLFEMRVKGNRGKIHFDFGIMSEDVDGNGSPNDEDTDKNYAVNDAEDKGLDTLTDAEEVGVYPDPYSEYDPAGDNYYFFGQGDCPVSPEECALMETYNPDNYQNDSIYYEWLNGTQGNADDIALGNAPDKEVLSSSSFETRNAYFSFVVDLGDPNDPFFVLGSERDVDGDRIDNPWRTYRIPIQDPLMQDEVVETDGVSAKWSQITYVRVWLEADDSATVYDTLEIADWYFVQSNWNDTIHSDPYYLNESNTDFVVASVSTEDGTFEPPPGVEAYTDESTNVTEPQRGLSLEYDSLHYGDTCLAEKNLVSVESYSGYRTMKMYVSGGKEDQENIMFFFRFGEDDENYYEYQKRGLYDGWDERNYLDIDFEELTAVKDEVQRNLADGLSYSDVDTVVGEYRIKGNPRLDEVLYFAAGVLNVDEENRDNIYTGKVILDELRLTDVRDNVGHAGRLSVSGKMADLIRYSFSYQSQDPYFRGISAATRGGSSNNLGSGKTQNSLRYDLTLYFDKFLPKSWNPNIPISFSKSETSEIPLLRTNSDILLPDDVRESEKTTGNTKSIRVSEAFNKAGRNPLFGVLLNRQKVSFSYSRSEKTSVNRPYSITENYNVKADYDMSIKNMPTLPIFFWTKPLPLLKKTSNSRLSIYPSSWRWSGTYNRNLSISDDINENRVSSYTRDFSGSMDMSYNVFDNLKTTFNYQTRRDLTDPDLINIVFSPKKFKLGLETSYGQSFTANYDPKLLNFLSSSFSYSARYNDAYDRSYKTRKSDLTRTWSVKGSLDHMKLFKGQSKSRSRGPRRTRPTRPGAKGGEIKAEEGDGTPFYEPVLAGLRFLTGWIEPINYKYGEGYSNSLPGMTQRPSWFYRFGVYDQPDVPTKVETRTQTASESQDYDLSSGFSFLGGIATDVKFSRSIDIDLIKTGTRYKNISTGWPELSIRIQKFNKLPIIKSVVNKFIEVFAPRTGYSRQVKEDINLNTGFTTSKTESISRNPLLSVNFKLFRALSLSASYTMSTTKTEKYSLSTGIIESETKADKKSFVFTTRYSFSSPSGISIPLFGKLRFKSTVEITLDIKYNSNITETNSGDGFRKSTDKSDISISPVLGYNFSQQIKGGLKINWQDTQDNYSGRRSHVREVQIWTEIRF